MRAVAVDEHLDEGGAASFTRTLRRFFHHVVAREHVHAIHVIARHPVGGTLCRNRLRSGLLAVAYADGVAVVLASEDDGCTLNAREVQRRVEVALARRAVAEARHGDLTRVAQLHADRRAYCRRNVRGDGGGDSEDVVRFRAWVRGHLPPLVGVSFRR